MANNHVTPAEAIPLILNCVQAHLATREDLPTPKYILLGAQGVSTPYGCCDGILVIESRGPIAYDARQIVQAQPSMISGALPCDAQVDSQYRVSFKMCAVPFDSTSMTGAAPKVQDRNELALLVMNETWELFQALTCCISSEYARVHSADHRIVNGCATLWVDITLEHETCC